MRDAVGLFDQSSFAKFRLEGADATRVLNRVCANDMGVAPGKIVYTQWLNERGGIEADLTVTRFCDSAYLIVTGAETETKDFNWLQRHIPSRRELRVDQRDFRHGRFVAHGTARHASCCNRSRRRMYRTAAFPFATSRVIELGYALVRASRITYVGELGWELYVPTRIHARACTMNWRARERRFGLVHAGYHALNSLRIEKAYRHWGHDITDEDTPLEAGLGFAVKWDKAGGFIGREALLRQRQAGLRKRLVQFAAQIARALAVSQRAGVAAAMSSSASSVPGCMPIPWAPPSAWAMSRRRTARPSRASVRMTMRSRWRASAIPPRLFASFV